MSVRLYKIKDWGTNFESHESRKYKRLDWVRVPNKHDGLGFRLIAAEKDGAALFGAWTLIVQIASKTGGYDSRGVLSRDGRPLTPADMSAMTGFPTRLFERALAFFTQPRIGWLVAEQWQTDLPLSPGVPGESPGTPGESPGTHPLEKRREEEIREDSRVCAAGAAPADDSKWLASLRSNQAYAGIDVDREYAKMVTWCQANKKQPNRRRFVNWLNRVERPLQTTVRPILGDLEPEGWRAYWRNRFPPEDCPDAPRYENGDWADVRQDHRTMIIQALRRKSA